MKKTNAGRFAILICFALVVALFAAAPAMAKTKHKLIKQYTYKYYDKNNKLDMPDGVKYRKTTIKYNKKKDPKNIKTLNYLKNGKTELYDNSIISYKYKKGVKKSCVLVDDPEAIYNTYTYKKGVPVKLDSDNDGYINVYDYSFKSRYAYKVKHQYFGSDESDNYKTTTKLKVKIKKGLPVKITHKDSTDNCYATFNTKGKAKGLLKKAYVERNYDESHFSYTYNYKYSFKKGLVKTAKVIGTFRDITEKKSEKYTEVYSFKYTKSKTSLKRYDSMFNDILQPDAFMLVNTYWF